MKKDIFRAQSDTSGNVKFGRYIISTKVSLLEIIQEVLQRPDHAKENTESLMKAEKKNQICTLEILV